MVGCAIARELSFSQASVVLLEAAHDVCEGASKGNTGIATSGADCAAGTLECDLVTRSSPRWERLCATLDTPFQRIGTLAVALTEEQEQRLPELLEEAHAAGARAEIVSGEAALRAGAAADRGRPRRAALSRRRHRRLDPADHRLRRAGMPQRGRGAPLVAGGRRAQRGRPDPRRADAGRPDRGPLRRQRRRARARTRCRRWPAGTSSPPGRARASTGCSTARSAAASPRWSAACPRRTRAASTPCRRPTGSLLLGPTAEDREDRADRGVDSPTLEHVFEAANALVPSLRREHAIKTFAANRPASDPVLPGRPRLDRREPGARGGHPLDRRLVVAGDGRARALAGR